MEDHSSAIRAFERAVKRIPPKDVELLRKLQSERLNEARRRVYSELAGREEEVPDPAHPGQTKRVTARSSPEQAQGWIDRIIRIETGEADF